MFKNLILILIFIFPLFGKSFNYTESIFFYGFSLLIFFYFFFCQKKQIYLSSKKIFLLLILVLLFLLSTIFSQNLGVSYYAFFTFLDILLFALISIFEIDNLKFQIGLIISSFVYSSVFLLNKIGLFPLNRDIIGDNFILQVWGHSYLADLLVISIPIVLYYLSNKKIKWRILFLIVFVVIFTALMFTNSRSALISLGIGLFFLDLKQPFFQKIKKIFIFFIFIISIIFSILVLQNKFAKKTFTGSREYYVYSGLIGFFHHPILGNGPNTYLTIIKKYQPISLASTNLSHSSLITYLSENGILFTSLFFFLIINSLTKTRKKNNLFFVCSLIIIIHSFLDPTWNSPGILIISLYFIFYDQLQTDQNLPISKNNLSKTFFLISTFSLLLFFISKTISDFFFLQGKFIQSLIFDPFNLNSRIALIESKNEDQFVWTKNLQWTLRLFPNHELVYQTLIRVVPLPNSEPFFYKLFEINPKEINKDYYLLVNYYKNNNEQQLNEILIKIENIVLETRNFKEKTILSKFYYHYGLELFSVNPEKSIKFLEKTIYLNSALSHFQIELANAYWHTNQHQKAIDQINACLKIEVAKKHCQWYLDNFENNFLYPGQKDFIDYIDNSYK